MLQIRIRRAKCRLPALQAVVLLLAGGVAYADTLVSCHDGDTCRFKVGESVVIARFDGIDAPEIDQPGGKDARAYLLKLLAGRKLSVTCHGSAKGRRQACKVMAGNQDVQADMVAAGWAWDYPEYSQGRYAHLQQQAMLAKKGLWSNSNPQSPYCWRWAGVAECTKTNNRHQP